jgi:hypothetical protein
MVSSHVRGIKNEETLTPSFPAQGLSPSPQPSINNSLSQIHLVPQNLSFPNHPVYIPVKRHVNIRHQFSQLCSIVFFREIELCCPFPEGCFYVNNESEGEVRSRTSAPCANHSGEISVIFYMRKRTNMLMSFQQLDLRGPYSKRAQYSLSLQRILLVLAFSIIIRPQGSDT